MLVASRDDLLVLSVIAKGIVEVKYFSGMEMQNNYELNTQSTKQSESRRKSVFWGERMSLDGLKRQLDKKKTFYFERRDHMLELILSLSVTLPLSG